MCGGAPASPAGPPRAVGNDGLAQAIADSNAQDIRESSTAAGSVHKEPEREGLAEYHGPCPRCAGDDRFRVYMRDRQHGICRRCSFGGDALDCCVALTGAGPKERGARSRYLREQGYLRAKNRRDY